MKDYKETARALLARRDEYLKEKKRRQRVFMGVSASVLCLLLAVATPFAVMKLRQNDAKIPNSLPETVDTDVQTTERIPVETGEKPMEDNEIIFPGSANSGKVESENNGTLDWLYTPIEGRTVYFEHSLKDALENASDTDRIAFAVQVYGDGVNRADDLTALRDKVNAAEEVLGNIANAEIERLMAQCGISRAEAAARKFTEGEFPSARAEALAARREYAEEWAQSYFENNSELFAALKDFGFEVLYSGGDAKYAVYLERISALGVLVGTKAQIEAFAESETAVIYNLCGAVSSAELINPTDFYSGSEVYLEDGSGLSAAVKEQFAELESGETLRVKVVYAYFGKEYQSKEELGQAALDAIGLDMTFLEWYCSSDNELFDKYFEQFQEAKRKILHNTGFKESVVAQLLRDGELVKMEEWNDYFIAELTYERALEIAQSTDVAYIDTEVNIYLPQYINGDYIVEAELE